MFTRNSRLVATFIVLLLSIVPSVAQSSHYIVMCRGGAMNTGGSFPTLDVTVDTLTVSNIAIQNPAGPRRLMFVQDVSRSMAQADAHAATLAIIREMAGLALPEDRLGLVDFSDNQFFDVKLSTPAEFLQALNSPKLLKDIAPQGGTRLYDAVFASAAYLEKSDPRAGDTLVVISDGFDNESSTSSKKLLNKLLGSEVRVFWVALATPQNSPGSLDMQERRASFAEVVLQTGGYIVRLVPGLVQGRLNYELVGPTATALKTQLTAMYEAIKHPVILQFDLSTPLRKRAKLSVKASAGTTIDAPIVCPEYVVPN